MKDTFVLAGILCFFASILVFSAGVMKFHRTERKNYRYDIEFDRAREKILMTTLVLGLCELFAGILCVALVNFVR